MREHLLLGTGGTCFSLTELLRHLARAAGLAAHPVMAHMRHGPNIHCALRVEAAGRAFLVDPGYLVRTPLPLGSEAGEPAPGEAFLVPAGSRPGVPAGVPAGDFDLFTLEEEGPRWRYRVSVEAPSPEAFQRFWRRSFLQPGMRSLLVTQRAVDGERVYLHNHKLRRRGPGERSSRNVRQDLERTVSEVFGIDPRVTRAACATLERERRERDGARRGP